MTEVMFGSLKVGDAFEVYGNDYLGYDHSRICSCVKLDYQTASEENGPDFSMRTTDKVMLPGTAVHREDPVALTVSLLGATKTPLDRAVDSAITQLADHLEAKTPVPVPLPTNPGSADDLRAQGLMVAVHNDYRLNGVAHTFWLFVDEATGMSYKGEGKTDAEALTKVREKFLMSPVISENNNG